MTFQINQTHATLLIDDLSSQTPLSSTVAYATPIKLEELYNQSQPYGNFALKPVGIDAVVSRLTYSIGGQSIFDFKLSLDQYYRTTPTEVTSKNYQSAVYTGYF
jgi:hypothetical protein